MVEMSVVELSRLQFALTALYHFLFVPLTLGLALIMAIMESVYVMTGKPIWRQMTRFWGTLFGINFAMGVATGITMEFQFGTNWAYYSHYVGDVFGAPLAIEGLMAFFLESTFVGLFFFGWDRLSKVQHLAVTWLTALGANLSALWILIANAWMQNPVGAAFNFETMRMEITAFRDVIFNPVAQSKFVHTVSAGYAVGAVFVLSISAWYLLRQRHVAFARRSLSVAAAFGLASSLSVVVLGDESGYTATENQKMKIAAIEAMWHTEPAPAPFTVIGIPDLEGQTTHYAIDVPWVLGLIATRTIDTEIPGITELVDEAELKIKGGLVAYDALESLRAGRRDAATRGRFEANVANLGYALLLKRYVDDPRTATAAQIHMAAEDTIPNVPVLFFGFRVMVAIGFFLIALFVLAFWFCATRRYVHCSSDHFARRRWYLRIAFLSLPLPWIASELGWVVAEYGRQPWAIEGVLPTFLGASPVPASNVLMSLAGFITLYSALAVVDVWLIVRWIRRGPRETEAAHG